MSHRVMSVLLSRHPKANRHRKAAAPAPAPEAAPAPAPAPEAAPEAEQLTMSNTKAELLAEAEAQGVAIPSGATKAQILEALYA